MRIEHLYSQETFESSAQELRIEHLYSQITFHPSAWELKIEHAQAWELRIGILYSQTHMWELRTERLYSQEKHLYSQEIRQK